MRKNSNIFGKVVQLKKGVTIDRDKTSINLNENMDNLVPQARFQICRPVEYAVRWLVIL